MANGRLQYGDIIIIGETVSGSGMQFLADEPNIDVNFNRSIPLQWEHFMIINAEYPASKGLVYVGDKVAILSYHGNFLTHDNNFIRSDVGKIENGKIWTIHNDVINNNVLINCSSGPTLQQGFINVKASNGKFLERNNTGDAVLSNNKQKLYYKIDEKYRSNYKIPQQNTLKFINCCNNKVTVPSKYGPLEVCEFGRHELIVLDLRGIAGEKGYFVSLSKIKPQIWVDAPMLFPNGSTGNLIEGSWISKGNAPNYLVVNDLTPNNFFGECIPSSNYPPFSPGEVYSLKVAIGNPWKEEFIFFRIK